VGRIQCPCALVSGQPDACRRWHPRCCRCLLKGCERWFLPPWPQARYCSPTCRKAAEHWRSWRAGQTYRATNQGKERRREQARRRRERQQQRSTRAEPAHQSPPIEPAFPVIDAQATLTPDSTPMTPADCQSVGQRPAEILPESCGLPCHRPGCYVLFVPAAASQDQKFCSAACRQALRRVRQREARLRHRRRRGARPLYRPSGGPPQSSPFMSSHP
jgi:predicted nucleic acid-binding Zn ribbon protein